MNNISPLRAFGGATQRQWLFATASAILIHGGLAAWLMIGALSADPDVEADGSAMPVDITALVSAAPEEIASKTGDPSPEVAPQQATVAETEAQPPPAVEKTDLLIEQQSPEESDVVLPKPSEEKKEEEPEKAEEEVKPTPPQQPTEAVAAQEAAAPAPTLAPPAPTPTSHSQGITPSQRRSRNTWEKRLVVHLDKHKRYPEAARASKAAGEVVVEFVMDRAGVVQSHRIVRGSGHAALDAEAVALLVRAAPLPLPPVDVHGENFHLVVPIRYRLK